MQKYLITAYIGRRLVTQVYLAYSWVDAEAQFINCKEYVESIRNVEVSLISIVEVNI